MRPGVSSNRTRDRRADGRLDPVVAVLVDSLRSEYLLAKTTVLRAVEHWGMPHKVIDLASTEDPLRAIGRTGVILIAQEYLGTSLAASLEDLIRHVEAGAGLVNLDHALMSYIDGYRALLGIEGDVEEHSVEALTVSDLPHTVLNGHRPGDVTRLKQPLPGLRGGGVEDDMLMIGDSGESLLSVHRVGQGRLVQWRVSPKLWNERYLGFAHGLDGLLWRSIIWSGPKPFAINAMRPFVRFRFDDCNGHWRDPVDLAFVDEFTKRGHVPSVCFCLRALTPDGAQHAAALQRAGAIDLAPHTLAPATSMFYGDSGGEYSSARFAELFAELDDLRRRWDVSWSTILSDHDHEWSRRAVPFLRDRGIRFKMNITLPGERWAEEHVDWRPGPFGSMNYALDWLPGDLSDFFVVFNHHPSFETARAYIDGDHRFIYHRPGGFGRQQWDFLNGLVRGADARAKDLDGVVDRIVEHTRIGLDARFFGGSISHSHFTRHLAPREWAYLLDRADRRLADVEQIPASYDEIAGYASARAGTRIVSARRGDDRIEIGLAGVSRRSLNLSVFDERDGELVRREAEIPCFDSECTVEVGLEIPR